MDKAISRDGTAIAFDKLGDGPPVIIIVGAFNDRAAGAPLAEKLASQFTTFNYDRRGRGESSDANTYEVQREVDDLAALIETAGGAACVFGYSSGAVLGLEAAKRGVPITKLALFEMPLFPGPGPRFTVDHAARLKSMLQAGDRGAAVEYFQSEVIGIPPEIVAQLRNAPFRPALEAMAQTLVYEAIIVGDGSLHDELATGVSTPTLAIAGGASFPFMRETAERLAQLLPSGRAVSLEGQTHDIVPEVLGPELEHFFQEG